MAFERIQPDTLEWEAYWANHIHRYQFASSHIATPNMQRVLDVACGVGYGAQFLANAGAASVLGVDRESAALEIANSRFRHPAVSYSKDECEELARVGVNDQFTAIVSFETLEHLSRPQSFLLRCHQLLKKDGVFIISTPNVRVRPSGEKHSWEFHECEYTPLEFTGLIRAAGFTTIDIYGQRMTAIGRLRSQVRAELNRLRSNPMARIGSVVQTTLRGVPEYAVLPETVEDFEMVRYGSAEECDSLSVDECPAVLVAVATRGNGPAY